MAQGISLHIGINRVDPDQYEGWDGQLTACEADAKDMVALAKARGFKSSSMLLTKAATADAVTAAILGAAKTLKSGDLFFLTYSGHGGQVRDTNSDEKDRMDETWVCYDRQLVDDELYELWGKFKAGVRISCCRTAVTAAPCCARSRRSFPAGRGSGRCRRRSCARCRRRTRSSTGRSRTSILPPKAPSSRRACCSSPGCMDNQTSLDGPRNGLFTGTLKKVWSGGKFKGSYRKLRDTIVAKMPPDQTPNYYFVGAANPKYEAQAAS